MSDRTEYEQAVLDATQAALVEVQDSLASRGVTVGELELVRSGQGDTYESELRLYGFKDDQICDALEVVVWSDGRPELSVEELKSWLRTQLPSLGVGD